MSSLFTEERHIYFIPQVDKTLTLISAVNEGLKKVPNPPLNLHLTNACSRKVQVLTRCLGLQVQGQGWIKIEILRTELTSKGHLESIEYFHKNNFRNKWQRKKKLEILQNCPRWSDFDAFKSGVNNSRRSQHDDISRHSRETRLPLVEGQCRRAVFYYLLERKGGFLLMVHFSAIL